jgi:predicted amidohydrolase
MISLLAISCVQMDVELGNTSVNLKNAIQKIEEAVHAGAKVVVLPELWTTGYCLDVIEKHTDEQDEVIETLKKIAKQKSIWLVGGSLPIKKETGVFNELVIINSVGELIKTYDKVHLFQLMNEHHFLQAGTSDAFFEIEGYKAAGFVCYDLRFPEWMRGHAIGGAKILFFVAQWPVQRIQHWEILLKARAIENQCFVVACNRVGKDKDNTFGGNSLIIDPWGEVLAKGGMEEEILNAQINLEKVQEIRNTIPIFEDRKIDLYNKF